MFNHLTRKMKSFTLEELAFRDMVFKYCTRIYCMTQINSGQGRYTKYSESIYITHTHKTTATHTNTASYIFCGAESVTLSFIIFFERYFADYIFVNCLINNSTVKKPLLDIDNVCNILLEISFNTRYIS